MAEKRESLIVQERERFEAQQELFDDPEIPKVDKTKKPINCTGDQLFQRRRDIYDAIVRYLSIPGCSIRWICRALHCDHHVVAAVRERQPHVERAHLAHEGAAAAQPTVHSMGDVRTVAVRTDWRSLPVRHWWPGDVDG